MNKVLVVNPVNCTGCRSCETACATIKENEVNLTKSRIRNVRFKDEYFYYPDVCLQCEIPYCALACPSTAITKNSDTGMVELNKDRCVGCKMCLMLCPFGAMGFVDGIAVKCDLCDGDPACVKACNYEALTYGEPDEIGEGKRVVVAEKVKEASSAEASSIPKIQAK